MIKLADLEFELDRKDFQAIISVGESGYRLAWYVELISKPKIIENEYDTKWQPAVLAHQSLKNLPALDTLANTEFSLADEVEDEPQFCLDVYDYEAIRDVTIRFGSWVNDEIKFSLTGIADVHYDDIYNENLNVVVKTKLKPSFVQIDTNKAEQAEQLAKQFFPNITFEKKEFIEGRGCFYYFNQNFGLDFNRYNISEK